MKYQHLLLILSASIISANSFAQFSLPSQKVIGGNDVDILTATAVTRDKGLIVAGYSSSYKSYEKTQNPRGYTDYWVVKLNSSGNIQWDKTIGGNSVDYLYSIQQTRDGGYILGGTSFSGISGEKTQNTKGNSGYGDYWIVKLDNAGNIQWDKTIGGFLGEDLRAIKQTSDGGYILGGSSWSDISYDKTENSRGIDDYWIVKLDNAGNVQWDKTIGGNDFDILSAIEQTSDGGYILGGKSASNISGEKTQNNRGGTIYGNDYWVVKLDGAGNIQWDKTIGGSGDDQLTALQQSKDSGYIFGGRSYSNISGEKTQNSRGGFDYWVVQLDNSGNIQWDKTIGGNDDDYLYTIKQTRDGGFITGGFSLSQVSGERIDQQRGQGDYWAVKMNNQGIIQWDKAVGGIQEDRLISIDEIARNKYILSGYSESDTSGDKTVLKRFAFDYWLVGLTYNNTGNTSIKETQNSNRLLGINALITYAPNPVKNILHIHLKDLSVSQIIVTDLAGSQFIKLTSVKQDENISLSQLHTGTYILQILDKNSKLIGITKIFKE